jgi:hypothetical protein
MAAAALPASMAAAARPADRHVVAKCSWSSSPAHEARRSSDYIHVPYSHISWLVFNKEQ